MCKETIDSQLLHSRQSSSSCHSQSIKSPPQKMALHLRSSLSKSTFLSVLRNHNLRFGSPLHATRHLRQNLPHGGPPLRVPQNPISRLCNTMTEKLSSIGQHEDASNQVHALSPIPITPCFEYSVRLQICSLSYSVIILLLK